MDFFQLKIIVIITMFFAVFSEISKKMGNPIFGLLAGVGVSWLMYKDNAFFIIGIFLLIFYFGFNIIMTILGNIKKVIP